MRSLSFAVVITILLLQSCKKENYTEWIKTNDTDTKATFRNGRIASSEVYDKSGKLDSKYIYNNGTVTKIYRYYQNQKVNSYSYMHKKPNHFTTTIYFNNGKMASEGEADFYKDKNLFLKRGPWIFYSKTGEAYSIYTFSHDDKNEYIKGETLFDTIQNKIIKDVIYDPPVLYKKGTTETVTLFNPK